MEFHSLPRPDRTFNLLYLEQEEFLISSVHSRLTSPEFETENGKLHLCTRSIIFQPQNPHLPLLKFKFSNSDFSYTFSQMSIQPSSRPISDSRKQRTSSMQHQSPTSMTAKRPKSSVSLQHSLEARPALVISVSRFVIIPRDPGGPHFTESSQDRLLFELSGNDLTRVATELEMLLRATDEREVAQIIFGLRYSELTNILAETDDFDPEEFLLQHKASRMLPEGLQMGAFVLTQTSFHFYPLVNARPTEQLHVQFRGVSFALRFRYLHRQTGIRVHLYTSQWPVILVFDTEEQRENIYSFLQNRVKFKNVIEELPRFTEKWTKGLISNFEYLMLLNNLGGRCVLDLSQYPVFPWVITNFHGEELELWDSKNYRDLSLSVGALNTERLARLKVRSFYQTHYSTPTSVGYFLIRKIPEMLIRLQNGIFGPPERFFKSVESTFSSCIHHPADFRELIPEFYALQPDFLLNTENMDLGSDEAVSDTELPLWARDALHFCELMRTALESDIVSESLNRWIDLIFGYKLSGAEGESAYNLFAQSAYSLPSSSGLELEANDMLAREFGQCPIQLFTTPHPQRRFRFDPVPGYTVQIVHNEAEQLEARIAQLQGLIVSTTNQHEELLKHRELAHKSECDNIKKDADEQIKTYKDALQVFETATKVNYEKPAPRHKVGKFGGSQLIFGLSKTSGTESLLKPTMLHKHPTAVGLQLLKPAHTESSVPFTQTPLSTSRKGSRRTKSITPPKPRPTSTLTLYKH